MNNKRDLGQFFTTNSDYILQGFEELVKGKEIIDPFAGGGDLLHWAAKHGATKTSGLDIDPKLASKDIRFNDSLSSIPYASFFITNPPYLAKNKMSIEQKQKYLTEYDDFYLLAIKKIIDANPDEGIIIIPVNFFSAENSNHLRKEFLIKFNITSVNYFKEQVFEDTTYNVVAFHYTKKTISSTSQVIKITSFPDKTSKEYELEEQFDYRIAGKDLQDILNTKTLNIMRLTEEHMIENKGCRQIKTLFNDKKNVRDYGITPSFREQLKNNALLINCIDTNASEEGWIKIEDVKTIGYDCLVGKHSSRNIAYIVLPDISLRDQKKIIPLFNQHLNALRKKYNSLFLTNFRDNDRKRASFDFCYKLISYCYQQIKS